VLTSSATAMPLLSPLTRRYMSECENLTGGRKYLLIIKLK
jgi:hypothetical protein